MRGSRARRAGATLGLLAALLAPSGVRAQGALAGATLHSTLTPGRVQLGEPTLYRGEVVLPRGAPGFRWLPPDTLRSLTWGTPRAFRAGAAAGETLRIEVPVQAFALGPVTIPGIRFEDANASPPAIARLPGVTLMVTPVLTAADSNADLHPARGPLPAPWWERVPWRWVMLGLALLALAVALWRWARSRRAKLVPAAKPALDPAARALEELEALRARHLPEAGRFDEHAFGLTRILRRFFEAVIAAPKPGHTTPELVAALAKSRIGPEDAQRLGTLLRSWDRLKFARAASSVEEARLSEAAVEERVRQWRAQAAAEPQPGKAA